MSDLDTLLATDIDLAFSDGGDAASYTSAAGGAATDVTVLLGPVASRRVLRGGEEADVLAMNISVRISEVASPAVGDTFTVGDDSWGVDAILATSAVFSSLACLQIERRSLGDKNRHAEVPA